MNNGLRYTRRIDAEPDRTEVTGHIKSRDTGLVPLSLLGSIDKRWLQTNGRK